MQNRKTKRRRIVVVFVAQLLLFSFSSSYSDLASHSRLSAKEWNQFPSDGVIACWSLFVRRIEEAESYFVRHEQCSEPPDQRQRRTKCKNLGDECAVWVCVRYTSYVVGGNTRSFHRHDSHKGLWNWLIVHEFGSVQRTCVLYGENARNRRESFMNYEHESWIHRLVGFFASILQLHMHRAHTTAHRQFIIYDNLYVCKCVFWFCCRWCCCRNCQSSFCSINFIITMN